ncbi:ShlB/FhaC/HecB family hemolysin secretion/activation protein [Paraburkholderia xenovorans]|uniref:ShlB/FhaC/HecB family hemolysin secretion/activation protein n=1 Tax=Paraburkholderia xenovorans TaxID=36873 RepID=UPI0038B9E4F0
MLEAIKPPPQVPPADPNVVVKPPEEAPPPKVEAPDLRFTPQGFRFTGNTVISSEELTALLAPYAFHEVDLDGLNEIVDKVKAFYRQRGYFLAVAFLPKQNISDGVVTIGILEGRLGKITVKHPFPPEARVTEDQVLGMLHARLKEGDIITERSVETPLLLIRDLPGAVVRSTLNRGAQVGTADLEVEVLPEKPKRITGEVHVDNYGNRYAGAYRLGVKASLVSPLGIGDLLSVQGFITNQNLSDFGDVSYLVPVGHLGTRVGVDYGLLNYSLGKEFADLNAHGTADVVNLFVLHPIQRSKDVNLFAQVGLTYQKLNDLQGGAPAQEKNIVGLKTQVNGDSRGTGYVNVYTAGVMFGSLGFGSDVEKSDDAGVNGFHTNGFFTKFYGDYQRLQQLAPNLALFFSASGQAASKNLTAAEKFALGGADRVRGYPEGEAIGDDGFATTLELRYTVPGLHVGAGGFVLTSFFDFGYIRFNAKPGDAPPPEPGQSNSVRLVSYGVGMNFGVPNKYLFRTSIAWHGGRKPTSDTHDNTPRVWVQWVQFF